MLNIQCIDIDMNNRKHDPSKEFFFHKGSVKIVSRAFKPVINNFKLLHDKTDSEFL